MMSLIVAADITVKSSLKEVIVEYKPDCIAYSDSIEDCRAKVISESSTVTFHYAEENMIVCASDGQGHFFYGVLVESPGVFAQIISSLYDHPRLNDVIEFIGGRGVANLGYKLHDALLIAGNKQQQHSQFNVTIETDMIHITSQKYKLNICIQITNDSIQVLDKDQNITKVFHP